jgi:hypothetical protein
MRTNGPASVLSGDEAGHDWKVYQSGVTPQGVCTCGFQYHREVAASN